MCDLAADLDGSAGRFATELEALEPFVADGVVHIEAGSIRIRPEGRALARTVCAVFDAYFTRTPRGIRAQCDMGARSPSRVARRQS